MLKRAINAGEHLQESTSPHDVAALLKQYLRELPEPLLTSRYAPCDQYIHVHFTCTLFICIIMIIHAISCMLCNLCSSIIVYACTNKGDSHIIVLCTFVFTYCILCTCTWLLNYFSDRLYPVFVEIIRSSHLSRDKKELLVLLTCLLLPEQHLVCLKVGIK